MYTKDKNHRVTLRLNETQFQFVKANADTLDVSPSDFLRMVINAAMVGSAKVEQAIIERGGLRRENEQGCEHHQL